MPVQSVRPVQRPNVHQSTQSLDRWTKPATKQSLDLFLVVLFLRSFRRQALDVAALHHDQQVPSRTTACCHWDISSSSSLVNYFQEPRIKGKKERFDTGFRIPTFLISVVQQFFLQRAVLLRFLALFASRSMVLVNETHVDERWLVACHWLSVGCFLLLNHDNSHQPRLDVDQSFSNFSNFPRPTCFLLEQIFSRSWV